MRIILGILFLALVMLPLFIRSSPPEEWENSAGKEEIKIISPHRQEVRAEYSRAFFQWMRKNHQRDVYINWIDVGGAQQITRELESRFKQKPESSGLDIMFGGGTEPHEYLLKQGKLQRISLPDEIMAGIPKRAAGVPVYDPDGHWYGVALSGFGIIYRDSISILAGTQPPRIWDDLGKPEFFGMIASGNPRASGAMRACYEIMLQAKGYEEGWALITKLAANVRRYGQTASDAPNAVAIGNAAAGLSIDQYARTTIVTYDVPDIKFIYPENMTMINPDAISILKGAPNYDLAMLFVQFALSDEGQLILVQKPGVNGQKYALNRRPVRNGIHPDGDLPEAAENQFLFDSELSARRTIVMDDLIGMCLIDNHDLLKKIWKKIIDRGLRHEEVQALCKPPIESPDWKQLQKDYRDPINRVQFRRKWNAEYRNRLETLYKQLNSPQSAN